MPGGIEGGRSVFMEEARELVDELEGALMGLEETPDDHELVDRVFRAMHTLKGSGSMFGFDEVAAFTHDIETYFDLVRSGELHVTKELVDLTLKSLDQITAMLEAGPGGSPAGGQKTGEISSAFRRLISDAAPPGKGRGKDGAPEEGAAVTGPASAARSALPGPDAATYLIRFRPSGSILLTGTNPLSLIDELRAMGECSVVAHTGDIPQLEGFDPENCYTFWDITLVTDRRIDAIRDVFIFVEDDSEITIRQIEGTCRMTEPDGRVLIGDLLVDNGSATPDAVERALSGHKRIGEALVEMGEVTPEQLERALMQQRVIEQRRAEQAAASVKVPSDKLDVLAELVGELVTAQSRLRRVSGSSADPELAKISEDMEKLAEMLRDNTLGMRMVPIGTTFTRFKRLVRDLAGELGKEVVFSTGGGETELDKTVIERLGDPIMHLIRNSIDHGIETPDGRIAAGKQRHGSVALSASQSGGRVSISITDDGRGLDPDAIRDVAVEKCLLGAEDRPGRDELFGLILAPGFSTSKTVSSVSGRGVGMDVVKRCVDSLRGTVEIKSSLSEGTAITLKLPLTLAIIDGLLVKVSESFYVVPLMSVMECVELTGQGPRLHGGRRFMDIRGELIPYIPLRGFFGINGDRPAIEHMVIVEEDGRKVGLTVDEVIGGHQTVIKPLGRACREVEVLSGATVLGDGMLALILDIPGLVRSAQREEFYVLKAATAI